MKEDLVSKPVQCSCGNTIVLSKPQIWCDRCCRPMFYNDRDRRRDRFNTYYMMGVIVFAIMLITYFFIELIAVPLTR
jgi:predicted nucleic acid-binding Zn ribbon protein